MLALPARYTPIAAPASGGMSHATVCRDSQLGRDVIVKELQDGQDERRLLDEIAALSTIRSKHVVQVYDVIRDRDGNIAGIVEEYISGAELTSITPINDAALLLRTAYAIACGVADIHNAGCIHRDIKPENIRFDAENCLKIFDFGLARAPSADAATEGAVGTPGYMAPELCVDDYNTAEFTQAIDVYAFAATMLRLTRTSLPQQMRKMPPDLPCAEANFASQQVQLPPAVAGLANMCLAADPAARPQMAQVRDAISAELLRDRHRASFVLQGTVHVLHAGRRSVTITVPGRGVATVAYDGLRFVISPVSGDTFVNNVAVSAPQPLPGSCVLTFGALGLGYNRTHIPLDVSHPEVWL